VHIAGIEEVHLRFFQDRPRDIAMKWPHQKDTVFGAT
jgi:hypothetical protein